MDKTREKLDIYKICENKLCLKTNKWKQKTQLKMCKKANAF